MKGCCDPEGPKLLLLLTKLAEDEAEVHTGGGGGGGRREDWLEEPRFEAISMADVVLVPLLHSSPHGADRTVMESIKEEAVINCVHFAIRKQAVG